MDRTVKARKNHRCTYCTGPISKGETYHLFETRVPVYVNDVMATPVQDGIEYTRTRMCQACEKVLCAPTMEVSS